MGGHAAIGAVGISKVDVHPGGLAQTLVFSHLFALIVGQRKPLLRLDAIEHMAEATERGFGTGSRWIRRKWKSSWLAPIDVYWPMASVFCTSDLIAFITSALFWYDREAEIMLTISSTTFTFGIAT